MLVQVEQLVVGILEEPVQGKQACVNLIILKAGLIRRGETNLMFPSLLNGATKITVSHPA